MGWGAPIQLRVHSRPPRPGCWSGAWLQISCLYWFSGQYPVTCRSGVPAYIARMAVRSLSCSVPPPPFPASIAAHVRSHFANSVTSTRCAFWGAWMIRGANAHLQFLQLQGLQTELMEGLVAQVLAAGLGIPAQHTGQLNRFSWAYFFIIFLAPAVDTSAVGCCRPETSSIVLGAERAHSFCLLRFHRSASPWQCSACPTC